ncbi:hypothetical protein KY308_03380 [Candidatus Woesearchaeota archaeon]|nr:hypothetical protein [Candidatus Woesearchaeota archaeon]
MQIKVKKQNKDGIVRLESSGEVKEILINETIMEPENETISVCFRGKDSSGIVDFSPKEIEQIYEVIRKRAHLIKGFRKLTSSGAVVFE